MRAKNIGTALQEVLIDGAPLEAPEGTLAFTGPGGCYLEFRPSEPWDGSWWLLLDGQAVQQDIALDGQTASTDVCQDDPAVAWWKFTLPDRAHQVASTHQVRVTFPGQAMQEVFVDGSPLDAPAGTLAFTGPYGSLLELRRLQGQWCLVVDGLQANRFNPNASAQEPPLVWRFGSHEVRALRAGCPEQELYVDGQFLPAPPGTTVFTGPGGVLCELTHFGGTGWALAVDGTIIPEDSGLAGSDGEVWTVMAPTGSQHLFQVQNMDGASQLVCIDGVAVSAPPGTTTFTGPGGVLLELRRAVDGRSLALFVDGLPIEEHNLRLGLAPGANHSSGHPAQAHGPACHLARDVVSSDVPLPQGVSLEAESGLYTANIRQHGRFVCLGKFATPDEAHACYLAAKQ